MGTSSCQNLTLLDDLVVSAGASGPVGIDKNGDRVASYKLQSVVGMKKERVANFFGTRLEMLNKTFVWLGGSTAAPLGRPVCGFDKEFCPEKVEGLKRLAFHFRTNALHYYEVLQAPVVQRLIG